MPVVDDKAPLLQAKPLPWKPPPKREAAAAAARAWWLLLPLETVEQAVIFEPMAPYR